MRKYKHKLTGAIICTECVCSGEGWEEISQPSAVSAEPPKEAKKNAKVSVRKRK